MSKTKSTDISKTGRKPRKVLPREFTFAELMAMKIEPLKSIVRDFLPEGVTLLAGAPKVGKSFMALTIALSVAQGKPALGEFGTSRGDVLYIALEDTQARLQQRANMLFDGDVPPIDNIDVRLDWPVIDPKGHKKDDGAKRIDEWLDEHPDAQLVVIDVLEGLRNDMKGGERQYRADYQALRPLIPIAAKHRVAILVLTHTRELVGNDKADSVSGTRGLTGAADTIMVLWREEGSPDGQLFRLGRDVDAKQYELEFGEAGQWRFAGYSDPSEKRDDEAAIRPRERAKRIITDMLQYGPVRQPMIKAEIEANHISWSTAENAKKDMGIKPNYDGEGWWWSLPDSKAA